MFRVGEEGALRPPRRHLLAMEICTRGFSTALLACPVNGGPARRSPVLVDDGVGGA
jgi:hypothetical protein